MVMTAAILLSLIDFSAKACNKRFDKFLKEHKVTKLLKRKKLCGARH